MTRWEYRTEKLTNGPKGAAWPEHLTATFNAAGQEGWELVNVAVFDRGTFNEAYAIFKRPMSGPIK